MKDSDNAFKNLEWKIEKFEPLGKDKRKSIYRKGGVLRVEQGNKGDPLELVLKIEGQEKFVSLPLFMRLGLTYTVVKGVYIIVAIVGNDPCELHKLILRFGRKKDGRLWFKFEVIPLYDDCVCEDEGIQSSVLFISAHGVGGGTGGQPN